MGGEVDAESPPLGRTVDKKSAWEERAACLSICTRRVRRRHGEAKDVVTVYYYCRKNVSNRSCSDENGTIVFLSRARAPEALELQYTHYCCCTAVIWYSYSL